jgi:uncharacterized integral membrane protein
MARRSAMEARRDELEREDRRRQRNTARAVGFLVLISAVIVFIVQNRQDVPVHFLVLTGHITVLWLIVIAIVVGAVGEALSRRAVRTRIRARRNQDDR